ncbi:MAG: hypothetical protein II988_04985 [Clostridia bacterium]|nr:hypothetical protein [Clostridia bacterium]
MKFVRPLICVFLAFCICFTLLYGNKKINNDYLEKTPEYKCLINLWQVDTFEGGTGSRKQFLLKVCREFERQYQGVLIAVSSFTIEGVKQALKKGNNPDMISYGLGVDLSQVNVLKEKANYIGGIINGKTYAQAWCRGGYCLVKNAESDIDINSNQFDDIIVSKSEFTQPLLALALEGVTVNNFTIKKPLDAYVDFINQKQKVFLCTQRDLVRLSNRGVSIEVRPMTRYNDIIQYVSLTTSDNLKSVYSERFIEYLLSSKVQTQLQQINMLSVSQNLNWQNQGYLKLQGVKTTEFCTLPITTSSDILRQIDAESQRAVIGEKTLVDKIKNLLVQS